MAARERDPQKLPAREDALFKSLCKHYEAKAYKKALKAADQILEGFPTHGETLAMKGLVLSCDGKKTEGLELIKLGLKNNMSSHVSWHVYGLYHRAEHNYADAIKCYQNALKHDKDNLTILRDLSLLQIHLRDRDGFVETRQHLFQLRPTHLNNWIGYVVALHLQGSLPLAIQSMERYLEILNKPEKPDYEYSEQLLYYIMLMEEAGMEGQALDYLEKMEMQIVDKLDIQQIRGRLLLKVNKAKARDQYQKLLEINPENKDYHNGLMAAYDFTSTPSTEEEKHQQMASFDEVYTAIEKKFPSSHLCKQLHLTGPLELTRFMVLLDAFFRNLLRRGTPTLFTLIKPVYRDASKIPHIEELLMSYVKSFESSHTFPNDSGTIDTPVTMLWLYLLVAQHYSCLGQQENALSFVDRAIQHTPTSIDARACKARILRRAGNIQEAADVYDGARRLDYADRYLNTRATKYLLRADRSTIAIATIALFLKEGENTLATLTDMQCMWFENELSKCYVRLGQNSRALKNLVATMKHFDDYIEDQFDFHYYCFRKMTVRAYLGLMRFVDSVYKNKFYVDAGLTLVKIYLAIHKNPALKTPSPAISTTTSSSATTASDKATPAKVKSKKSEPEKKDASKKKGKTPSKPAVVDPDPEGITLLSGVTAPLGEAMKILNNLNSFSANVLDVHTVGFEVFMLAEKYLMALRAINQAAAVTSYSHPAVHKMAMEFFHTVDPKMSTLPPQVTQVIETQRALIIPANTTLPQVNATFIANAGHNSVAHATSALQCAFLLDPPSVTTAVALFDSVSLKQSDYTSIKDCIEAVEVLKSLQLTEAAEKLMTRCNTLMPLATSFQRPIQPPVPVAAVAPEPTSTTPVVGEKSS
ncbi:N-terminal acetyltransferase A complex auxiliary subunit NAA15 [Pelomyxa schiedti]|nr:N-terminal acetyltransferase A complex auxiliary subunit NAA15 [Pelomyxa schiedti]